MNALSTTVHAVSEVELLKRSLNAPSLSALSYALRHPETWPKGFRWYYGDCSSCAMGLARQLWPATVGDPCISEMARVFAIQHSEAKRIFWRRTWYGSIDISPERVADRIDSLMRSHEWSM